MDMLCSVNASDIVFSDSALSFVPMDYGCILYPGKKHYLKLDDTAVVNVAGLNLDSDYMISFTAGLDNVPPKVIATYPVHGSTGFSEDDMLVVWFDEDIYPSSAEIAEVYIKPKIRTQNHHRLPVRDKKQVAFFQSYEQSGELQLISQEPFQPRTTYDAIVTEASILDWSGNEVERYTFTFTTGDKRPPRCKSVSGTQPFPWNDLVVTILFDDAEGQVEPSSLFRGAAGQFWLETSGSELVVPNVLVTDHSRVQVDGLMVTLTFPMHHLVGGVTYSLRWPDSILKDDYNNSIFKWDHADNNQCHGWQFKMGWAAPPEFLQLEAFGMQTVVATYKYGRDIGLCACAAPVLQLQANDEEFVNIGGDCAAQSSECTIANLQPDTLYSGRLKITCANSVMDSPVTNAKYSVRTALGCTWLSHSGRDQEFLCADGTFCPMTSATCCNGRGGRARCPRSTPVMCKEENACADGQDYCCAVDCSAHQGPRPCVRAQIAAKAPTLAVVESLDEASLAISWKAGEHPPEATPCIFKHWLVEVAEVDAGVNAGNYTGDWTPVCRILSKSVTQCTADGLAGMSYYLVRVRLSCTDSALNSFPSVTEQPIVARPVRSDPPDLLSCTNINESAFKAQWSPRGVDENCTFLSWELQYRKAHCVFDVTATPTWYGVAKSFTHAGPCDTVFVEKKQPNARCQHLYGVEGIHLEARPGSGFSPQDYCGQARPCGGLQLDSRMPDV